MLNGYRVLDLTDEKGSVCGKILGDLGADVIKIERPGGDLSRRIGPFLQNTPDPEKSLHWSSYNSSKRGITLNLDNPEGQEIFKKLADKVDVIIESFAPGHLQSLGLGYVELSASNPKLIMTSITPFGQTGPYKDRKASDLAILAMSGLMSITGDPDRAPVRMCLDQTYSLGGIHAVVGILLAINYRRVSGEGQYVDVSMYEAAVRGNYWEPARWEFLKVLVKRAGNRFPRAAAKGLQLWRCKDGYVTWLLTGGVTGAKQMKALITWMSELNRADILKDVDWATLHLSEVSQEQLSAWEAVIEKFFTGFTMDELEVESIKRGIPMARVNRIDNVTKDTQPIARGFWKELPVAGTTQTIGYPAFPFLASETDTHVKMRAPKIGEHNEEIYEKELGLSKQSISSLKERGVL
ncbi:MAG TPA: CoA transferase [Syntrophorhabdaceae bacterium]|nr:CoA transferase [Syntrophorhabdaceae bacterium]